MLMQFAASAVSVVLLTAGPLTADAQTARGPITKVSLLPTVGVGLDNPYPGAISLNAPGLMSGGFTSPALLLAPAAVPAAVPATVQSGALQLLPETRPSEATAGAPAQSLSGVAAETARKSREVAAAARMFESKSDAESAKSLSELALDILQGAPLDASLSAPARQDADASPSPAAGDGSTDADALETLIRAFEKNSDPILGAQALELGKRIMNTAGIEHEEAAMGGNRRAVLIKPSLKTALNALALSSSEKFGGVKLYFDPLLLGERKGFSATYDTDEHSISLAKGFADVIRAESKELVHELIHARLSNDVYREGKDSIYSAILQKKKLGLLDGLNHYAKFLSIQEFATYPVEFNMMLTQAKNASPASRDAIMADLNLALLISVSPFVTMTIAAMKELLAGLASGTTAVAIDDSNAIKSEKMKFYRAENNTYRFRIAFRETPPDLAQRIKDGLLALQSLAAQTQKSVQGILDELGGSKNIEMIHELLERWTSAAESFYPERRPEAPTTASPAPPR